MTTDKLDEASRVHDAINNYMMALDSIKDILHQYNINPDTKYKIVAIMEDKIEWLHDKFEKI